MNPYSEHIGDPTLDEMFPKWEVNTIGPEVSLNKSSHDLVALAEMCREVGLEKLSEKILQISSDIDRSVNKIAEERWRHHAEKRKRKSDTEDLRKRISVAVEEETNMKQAYIEFLCAAFIAETGIEPSEAVLIEDRQCDGFGNYIVHYRVEKIKEEK